MKNLHHFFVFASFLCIGSQASPSSPLIERLDAIYSNGVVILEEHPEFTDIINQAIDNPANTIIILTNNNYLD